MTLTLRVDAAAWRARVESIAAAYHPVVPVVKGNGYGFGRDLLSGIAEQLLDARPADAAVVATVAVGTVFELDGPTATVRRLVLTPVAPGQSRLLRGHDAVVTIGSLTDIDALDGWHGPALVKLRSTMRRYGASPDEIDAVVERATGAGLRVIGASIHLPLAGTDDDRIGEIEAWLPAARGPLAGARQIWVSHLAEASHAALVGRHPEWRFPMRVGTRLWHGDKSTLHLTTDVVLTRPVGAGECAGYHATPAPADGTIVVVGAGTSQGIAPLADGRSPFHIARQRVALLEAPHMHASILFMPMGDDIPAIGQAVDVQRPLISISADEVLWT